STSPTPSISGLSTPVEPAGASFATRRCAALPRPPTGRTSFRPRAMCGSCRSAHVTRSELLEFRFFQGGLRFALFFCPCKVNHRRARKRGRRGRRENGGRSPTKHPSFKLCG